MINYFRSQKKSRGGANTVYIKAKTYDIDHSSRLEITEGTALEISVDNHDHFSRTTIMKHVIGGDSKVKHYNGGEGDEWDRIEEKDFKKISKLHRKINNAHEA